MSRFLIFFSIVFFSYSLYAEIVLDGSLGTSKATLSGPDYTIGEELGRQNGNNLFHSFNKFNINSHESVTFLSPDSINNIISRVTGGTSSNIDGLIRSNANLYLLNPSGIIFGENAQLDIQGSFHASTADYLKFKDGHIFDAHNLDNPILSIAPVESFGFLSNSTLSVNNSDLSVPVGESLSLIGGNLQIDGAYLNAASGRINLIGAGSVEKVNLQSPTNGSISLNNSTLNTSGDKSGTIFIRGGNFKMRGGLLDASTDTIDGEGIDIEVDELLIADGGAILADTVGTGKSGGIIVKVKGTATLDGEETVVYAESLTSGEISDIVFEVGELNIINGSLIGTGTYGSGNAGNIIIKVTDGSLQLLDGAQINTLTFDSGDSGNINIVVKDSLKLAGEDSRNIGSLISVSTEGIDEHPEHVGNAGIITIIADSLSIADGGQITSGTFGSDDGGKILIKITENIELSGVDTEGFPSGIFASSNADYIDSETQLGKSGNILLETRILNITDEAKVSAITDGAGAGGNIEIKAQNMFLSNYGNITAAANFTGRAGSLILNVDKLQLEHGFLKTIAEQTDGGNIFINANKYIHLTNSDISTSVKADNGSGGNINLKSEFIIQNYGRIIARAFEGSGGNINITTSGIYKFIPTLASPIDASSKFGLNGIVEISSPDGDANKNIVNLSTDAFDASNQLKTPCNTRLAENLSSFTIIASEGVPNGFNDLLPSGPMLQPMPNILGNWSQSLVQKNATNTVAKKLRKLASGCIL
ncbi:MAG: filamentous hemagglutinin N-terminal domain-containing protein [Proteobacteria bacterium]|nr:filamentous hemagglutinin N-terminal domain-containing protein [Pseudomonadota bacterium]